MPLAVTILADASYYSHSDTSTVCLENSESPFKAFNVRLADAHKTGLGSSAALVSAFTAAILKYYQTGASEAMSPRMFKTRAHNLAQVAHCVAQGKIGSGFDVAAAIFGSCVYRRFSPSVIENVPELGSEGFAEKLRSVVDEPGGKVVWDTEIDESAIGLPTGLRLVMCDVDCGSQTPSMVKKVNEWRKQSPEEALHLWQTLQKGNEDLMTELQQLRATSSVSFENLRDLILTNRSLIREMSTKANVPIEPPTQTVLIDTCCRIDGVVGGLVPGAGGFDALVLILEDKEQVVKNLDNCLGNYESSDTIGADVKIGKVRLLDVKQESEGIREEPDELYHGWLSSQ